MNIGIIVHSQTGHTLLVGERIQEKLRADGHEVTLIRMQNINGTDGAADPKNIQLDRMPEVDGYDGLIFGAWVQAFNLCPGFSKYIQQLPKIETDQVGCFLTQQFRYKWMGGNLALAKMKKAIAAKDAKVRATGVINWSNKKRDKQIEDLAATFSRQFQI